MATLTIQEIPIGSQYTQSIGTDDSESLNDFPVRIIAGENVSDLVESSLSVSSGSIVSLEGQNSVWTAVVRPPETASVITFTVAADAFSEGNVETEKDIRISTSFPDADAEIPAELFDSGVSHDGITLTPTRILLSEGINLIYHYTYSGIEQVDERVALDTSTTGGQIDYFNNSILIGIDSGSRYSLSDGSQIERYRFADNGSVAHTEYGIFKLVTVSSGFNQLLPYGLTETSDIINISRISNYTYVARQSKLLYLAKRGTFNRFLLVRLTAPDTLESVKTLNIGVGSGNHQDIDDIAIYRDTLYTLESQSVYTLDIRPYRPMSLNTKTRIDVQFIDEGGTLPLTPFAPDAETFTFATGFDKPTYLSINASNEIEVASSAVTETTPVLVRLTGINRIDSQDLSFYLVIRQAANPTVRDIDELAMYASTTFNLFDIVNNAASITFRTGQTQPTGSSISSGIFTIGTVGGTAYFTATNSNGSTNFEIAIDVVSVDPDSFSDTFRYRTEIAGIDVSQDVKGTPTVSESIDEVRLNVVTANRVRVTLRSDSTNGFKFNGGIADNFWDANSLNADGFQEPIKVYIESLISGSYVRSLLFSGRIHEPAASISEAEVRISAVDISTRLRNTLVSDFGTLTKWDVSNNNPMQ